MSDQLIVGQPRKIMRKRCKGCIAPAEGFNPDPMCEDFKRLVDAGKMEPIDACWSCFHTCAHKNIAERKTQLCRGSAEYFGAIA